MPSTSRQAWAHKGPKGRSFARRTTPATSPKAATSSWGTSSLQLKAHRKCPVIQLVWRRDSVFELGGVGFCVREDYGATHGNVVSIVDEVDGSRQQCSVCATDLGWARLEIFGSCHHRSDRLWQLWWRWQKADGGYAGKSDKECRFLLLRLQGSDGLREFLGISGLRASGPRARRKLVAKLPRTRPKDAAALSDGIFHL